MAIMLTCAFCSTRSRWSDVPDGSVCTRGPDGEHVWDPGSDGAKFYDVVDELEHKGWAIHFEGASDAWEAAGRPGDIAAFLMNGCPWAMRTGPDRVQGAR